MVMVSLKVLDNPRGEHEVWVLSPLQMSAHRACRHLRGAKLIRLQLLPPRSLNFPHVLY